MKPFISSIIVAYKSEKFINACIKSIETSARFAKRTFEIVVVVNDRQNNLYRFPKGVAVVRSKQNIGYAAGINEGAKHARGDWLLCVNPDTISDLKLIKFMLPHTKKPMIGVITPKILNPDGTLQFTITNDFTIKNLLIEQLYLHKLLPWFFSTPQSDPRHYEKTHPVEISFGTCFLIRNSLFKSLGGFCEDFFLYLEDYDFCRKVKAAGFQIIFEPKATQIHYGQQSNKGYKDGKAYFRSVKSYIGQNHSWIYTTVLVSILIAGSFIRYLYWAVAQRTFNSDIKSKKEEFYRSLIFRY